MQILNKNHAFFHQVILILLILITAGIDSLLSISVNVQIVLFLAITLSMGIFHGMLDIVLLRSLQFKQISYLFIYTALALAALLFFLNFPNTALLALLILSVWHFGEAQQSDDSAKIETKTQLLSTQFIPRQFIPRRFLLGACALAAPFMLANQSLHEILVILLTDANWLLITWTAWGVIAWAWLIAFFVCLIQLVIVKTMPFNYATLLEILTIWLGFYLLSPLIAFSLYFGAYHAVRHIRDVVAKTKAVHMYKTALALVGIFTLSMLTLITLILNNNIEIAGLNVTSSIILFQSSIVLLVAITLPHSFLISIWRKKIYKSL